MILAWSLLFFVIVDFSNYLTHFVPVLWELHKVHHSATFLNPLTTKRMHPLGDMFDQVVATLFCVIPFGLCQYWSGLKITEIGILL